MWPDPGEEASIGAGISRSAMILTPVKEMRFGDRFSLFQRQS